MSAVIKSRFIGPDLFWVCLFWISLAFAAHEFVQELAGGNNLKKHKMDGESGLPSCGRIIVSMP